MKKLLMLSLLFAMQAGLVACGGGCDGTCKEPKIGQVQEQN